MSNTTPAELPRWRRRALIVLSVLPFLWPTLGVFFADRPSPFVLGLPFLVFWAALSAVVAGACLSAVYFFDPRNGTSDSESGESRVAGSS